MAATDRPPTLASRAARIGAGDHRGSPRRARPRDKGLLQDAAVVGKTFWLGAVAAIGGDDRASSSERLHGLERTIRPAGAPFIGRRRDRVRVPAPAAPRRRVRADPARGPGREAPRAADWIGSLGGERLEDRAELLAHHYLSAIELARAAGEDTADVERPARLALARRRRSCARPRRLRARPSARTRPPSSYGRRTTQSGHGSCSSTAGRHGSTATRCEILAEARDAFLAAGDVETAAVAEVLIGDMVWRRGRGKEAQDHFDRAEALVEGRPALDRGRAGEGHLAKYFMVTAGPTDSIPVGREALAVTDAVGADEIRAPALNSMGTSGSTSGISAGSTTSRRASRSAEAANLPWHVGRGYVNLGVSYSTPGTSAGRSRCIGASSITSAGGDGGRDHLEHGRGGLRPLPGRPMGRVARNLDAEIDTDGGGRAPLSGAPAPPDEGPDQAGPGGCGGSPRRHRAGRGGRAERGDPQALMPNLAERGRILFLLGRTEEAVASIRRSSTR